MVYYRNTQPKMVSQSNCSCNKPMPMDSDSPSYISMPVPPIKPYSDSLAMAYVPWQIFAETPNLEKGYEDGTIFPGLNKPFMCGGR